MKLVQALLLFGILQAFGILMFVWLANSGQSYPLLIGVVFTDYLFSGMGTAAFVALIMSLCDKHYTATQFALLSSLSSIARESLGPVTAALAATVGWTNFYWFAFLTAWPGIIILLCTKNALTQNTAYKSEVVEPREKPEVVLD
jgi:PAT family beta-lactamase induction signal transducer AmpG